MLIEIKNIGVQIEFNKTINPLEIREMAINPNSIKYIYKYQKQLVSKEDNYWLNTSITKDKWIDYYKVYFNDDTVVYILEKDYIKLFDK